MHIWSGLIPKACLVLNLLRHSRVNLKFSAYAQVHGANVLSATSVAPPRTFMVVHEKPDVCRRWEIWGIHGWYLGHALHHYICFEVLANNTARIHIANTVEFSPHDLTIPFSSSSDNTIEAAKQLAHDLQNQSKSASLFRIGVFTMEAIK